MTAITFITDPHPAIMFGEKEFCTLLEEKPGYYKGWLPGPGIDGSIIFIPTGVWSRVTFTKQIGYLNKLWKHYKELPPLPEKVK